jgi:uncharacterized damage-inducible protein DinB
MTEHHYSLSFIYTGWRGYQQRLVSAITPLSSVDQLALHLPHHWEIGRIAAHIIAARVWWFLMRMGEGSTDLAPLEFWDNKGQPLRSAAELVDGLERTGKMIWDALDRWTINDLEDIFPSRPEDAVARSRRWIVWHVLEHDVFHGGEISCILGAHGLAGVALE